MVTIDAQDQKLALVKAAQIDQVKGPRTGDFVKFADGTILRVGCFIGNAFQPFVPGRGSVFLGSCYTEFGGRPEFYSIPVSSVRLTDEVMDGEVWFFHHNEVKAGGRVNTSIPFRVYTVESC